MGGGGEDINAHCLIFFFHCSWLCGDHVGIERSVFWRNERMIVDGKKMLGGRKFSRTEIVPKYKVLALVLLLLLVVCQVVPLSFPSSWCGAANRPS